MGQELPPLMEPPAEYSGYPQLEDGYTKIANELMDAIIWFDFSKRQYKVILYIIRKTYGWNKKQDVVSLSQILEGTQLARSHACNTINELVSMGVLLKQSHRSGQVIEINKKYKEWGMLEENSGVTETVTEVLPKREQTVTETVTTKETTKRQLKKYIPDDFGISDRVKLWADKNGHSKLEQHLDNFILQSKKQAYKYADWDAAFMTAIRDNWAKVKIDHKRVAI